MKPSDGCGCSPGRWLRRSRTAALRYLRTVSAQHASFSGRQRRNVREQTIGRVVPRHALKATARKMWDCCLTASVRARSPGLSAAALLLLPRKLLSPSASELPISRLFSLVRRSLLRICLQPCASFSEVELLWAPLEIQPFCGLAGSDLQETSRNLPRYAPPG